MPAVLPKIAECNLHFNFQMFSECYHGDTIAPRSTVILWVVAGNEMIEKKGRFCRL